MENEEHKKGEGSDFTPEHQELDKTQTIVPTKIGESVGGKTLEKNPERFCDRYRVIKKLGEGNMGSVWLCDDSVGSVQVAIKAVPVRKSGDTEIMKMVRDNFRIVQKLNHPNIGNAKSLEYEAASGNYFLVMEYIDGETLDSILHRYPSGMPLEEIIPIMRQVAAGLDYSHEKTTVHRDVKPSNIIIEHETGAPKVVDFGIAGEFVTTMLRKKGKSVTDTTSQSGTPYFMAPEQWRGYKQDGRTDQYGLAATVYALLDGRPPFAYATHVDAVMDCALNVPIERLDNVNDEVWSVLEKAFAKDKNNRYDSCSAFIDALEATTVSQGTGHATSASRTWGWWAAAAALVMAGAIGVPKLLEKSVEVVPPPVSFHIPEDLHYHALVVGINDYQDGWPKLHNAVNDAEQVSKILQDQYGFSVTTLLDKDATQARITGELERITNKTVRDMVLIYFAGHGERYRNPDEGYWIPYDAMDKSRVPEAKSSWIWNSVITRYIEASSARHILVVADACYAGSLFKTGAPNTTTTAQKAYRELLDRPSRHVLTSGNYENVFDKKGNNHSPFAQYFLDYLGSAKGPVFSVAELSEAIRPPYEKITSKSMRLAPLIRDSGGQFIFVRRDIPRLGLLDALDQRLSPATLVSERVYEGLNLLVERGHSNAAARITQKLESGDRVDQLARVLIHQADAERRDQVLGQTRRLIDQIARQKAQAASDPVFAEKRAQYATPRILTVLGPQTDGSSEALGNQARTYHRLLTASLMAAGVRVVQRDILNEILTEVDLDAAGMTDERVKDLVGKMLPATLILNGELVPGADGDLLSLGLVETSTSQTLPLVDVTIQPGDDLKQRCDDLVQQLLKTAREHRPFVARVIKSGDKIQLLAGRFHGVGADAKFQLVRRTVSEDLLFKEVRDEEVGHAEITVLGENSSDLKPTWNPLPAPEKLDDIWVIEAP